MSAPDIHLTRTPSSMIFRHFAVAAALLFLAAACDDEQAPPFEIEGTGDVAGQLFFDADNNGQFSPLGGDTLLRNVEVKLVVRNDPAQTIATTTTTAEGRFSFADVAAGTHQLVIVTNPAIAALSFCTIPASASVYIGEQTFLRVPAKRGCVVRIAEAKKVTIGQSTTVAGIVTAAQGTYRSDNVYIQDPTGGIQIFGVPGSLGLQLGDSIEVTGNMGVFRDELQIVLPTVAPNVVRVTPLAPVIRTAKQLTDAAVGPGPKSPDVGLLMTVRGIRSVGAFASGNATITDATGSIQLRLDGSAATAIPATTFQAGKCYDITGILGYSFGILQLKPRMLADVREVTCPA